MISSTMVVSTITVTSPARTAPVLFSQRGAPAPLVSPVISSSPSCFRIGLGEGPQRILADPARRLVFRAGQTGRGLAGGGSQGRAPFAADGPQGPVGALPCGV